MEQRRMMTAIFLGASILLLSTYVLANRSGDIPEVVEKNNEGQFFTDGSAIMDQIASTGEEWMLAMGSGAQDASEDLNNTTKNVAKAAFYQMKALDQQGKSPFDKENTNTPEVQTAIESSLNGSVDSFFGNLLIGDRDIKISANNTTEAKKKYLRSFETVLARYPATADLGSVDGGLQGLVQQACAGDDDGVSGRVANLYDAIAKDVMAVTAPSSWVDFHKQAIEHYKKGGIIFSAIANCNADPLRGVVAAQKIPKFGMDALTLQNLLKKMYTEVRL